MTRLPLPRVLASTLALALCLLAPASAHAPAGPDPACDAAATFHHYVGQATLGPVGTGFVVDGSLAPCGPTPGIEGDGEPEFGVGLAFLHGAHHDDEVCVEDALHGDDALFVVGADADGDGLVVAPFDPQTGDVRGCVEVAFPVGADGGWWVFLVGPATTGDVW